MVTREDWPTRPMNKDYPQARFDTVEEYKAAAALVGMWYDKVDHTFNPGSVDDVVTVGDIEYMYCPDTLHKLVGAFSSNMYTDAAAQDYRQAWLKRNDDVLAGNLGVHPKG